MRLRWCWTVNGRFLADPQLLGHLSNRSASLQNNPYSTDLELGAYVLESQVSRLVLDDFLRDQGGISLLGLMIL